ncbi:MAG TPA: hypothetical protein VLZ83_14120 [Edaphocola sp.]|nr:hypothetical protein [Edaphocola sp.]
MVLYIYDLKAKQLKKQSLFNNNTIEEQIPKAIKPDFESIFKYEDYLIILGSGSTAERNKWIKIQLGKGFETIVIDQNDLYTQLKRTVLMADEDFNIEGVVLQAPHLLLFNRGNGPNATNGIFKINHWQRSNPEISFIPIDLLKIEGVTIGFTDAVQVADKIYFIAAAEEGNSTYFDGKVLGSFAGILDAKTLALIEMHQLSDVHKFEGISLYKKVEDSLIFLLCEDSDDENLDTQIFEWTVHLQA